MKAGGWWAFVLGALVGATAVALYTYRRELKLAYENRDKIDPVSDIVSGVKELFKW